jgi:phosphatidylglycerophosphatase A
VIRRDARRKVIQQQTQWGHRAAILVATGFGAGKAPVAPGTVGTLLGIPLFLILGALPPLAYGVIVIALFVAGGWICQIAEEGLGEHDPPAIVWDEIVGFLITMFLAPAGWRWLVIGFLLFRLFDIWKPFPIRIMDRMEGGFSVMADDAIAGVYACVVLQLLVWVGNY